MYSISKNTEVLGLFKHWLRIKTRQMNDKNKKLFIRNIPIFSDLILHLVENGVTLGLEFYINDTKPKKNSFFFSFF